MKPEPGATSNEQRATSNELPAFARMAIDASFGEDKRD
jgi:hypothetical protein